jgi:glucokinase
MTTLGEALTPWLGRFGASVLVVGGSMTRSWDLVGPPLLTALGGVDTGRGAGTHLEVVVARQPDDAALIGAARHARDRTRDRRRLQPGRRRQGAPTDRPVEGRGSNAL